MKQIVVTLLLILPLLLQGQNIKFIRFKPKEVATLNLSQITEKVTPISLSSYKDLNKNGYRFFYITDDYLFVIGTGNAIAQLNISGKYIKTVYCSGYITGITGDPVKKEIYICTNSKVICCDYSLTIKKIFTTMYNTQSIFFYNNKLCIASYECKENGVSRGVTYRISSMNTDTGKEKFFPLEIKTRVDNQSVIVIQKSTFSVYNDQIVYSNPDNSTYSNIINSTLYGIKGDSIYPLIQYEVEPLGGDSMYMITPLHRQGFIGKNLLVEYQMASSVSTFHAQSFIYLEDMETGRGYNLKETINDDLYHTGNCKLDCFANKQGYFIICREENDLKKSPNLKIPTNSPAIFIVKMK